MLHLQAAYSLEALLRFSAANVTAMSHLGLASLVIAERGALAPAAALRNGRSPGGGMTKSDLGSARGRVTAPGLAQVRSPPSLPPVYLIPVLPPKHVLSHRNN